MQHFTTDPEKWQVIKVGQRINRRYKVMDHLGQGGMGSVYRVCDLNNQNEEVALKFLHVKGSTKNIQDLFKKEFQIVSKINHPNIAKVFDFGLVHHLGPPYKKPENTLFFFTSELVLGKQLFEALHKASLTEMLQCLLQLSQTIHFLESQNIIHRDIKSSNILVPYSEGISGLKILDFGIAVEALEEGQKGSMGTILYIAPEVLSGEKFDQRADLYSLGVIFYHLLTKNFPFKAENPVEMMDMHETQSIIAPIELRPEIPEALSNLVMQLLKIDFRERFFSASQVTEELEILLKKLEPSKSSKDSSPTSYMPKFIGRDLEINHLNAYYQKSLLEPNDDIGAVILQGDSGYGKTALLNHFKNFLQLEDFFVIWVRASPIQQGYQPFLGLIDFLLSCLSNEQLFKNHSLTRKAKSIASQDSFITLFNEIITIINPDNFKGFAILIDDVHYLSEDNSRLLHALIYACKSKAIQIPVLIAGTSTTENLKGGLSSATAIQMVQMNPFSPSDIAEYLKVLTGQNFEKSSFPKKIATLSGGNISFIEEITSLLLSKISHKKSIPNIEKALDALSIPQNMSGVLERRWQTLNETQQGLLKVLAALEGPWDFYLLLDLKNNIISTQDSKLINNFNETIYSLVGEAILIKNDDDSYNFLHAFMRDVILSTMKREETSQIHLILATFFERQNCDDQESLTRIAHHYFNSPNKEKAFHYIIALAQLNQDLGAWGSAVENYKKALSITPKENQLAVMEKIAHLSQLQGNLLQAQDFYIRIRQNCERDHKESLKHIHTLLSLGKVHHLNLEPLKALEVLDEAKNLAQKGSHTLLTLQIAEIRGRVFLRLGKFEDMHDEASEGIKLAIKMEAFLEEATLRCNLGLATYFLGKSDLAVSELSKSISLFEKLDQYWHKAYALNGLGYVFHQIGDYDRALSYYMQAYIVAIESDENRYLINIVTNIATIFHQQMEFKKAQDYYEQALELAERNRQEGEKAKILQNLGNLFIQYGHFSRALPLLRQSLEITERLHMDLENISGHLFWGDLLLEQEQWTDALSIFEKALEMAQKLTAPHLILTALHGKSLCLIGLNQEENAFKLLNQCQPTEPLHQLAQHWRWAEYYVHIKDKEKANHHFEQLLRMAQKEENQRRLWPIWSLRGEYFEEFGTKNNWLKSYSKAETLALEFAQCIPEEYRHYFFNTPKVARLRNKSGQNLMADKAKTSTAIPNKISTYTATLAPDPNPDKSQ